MQRCITFVVGAALAVVLAACGSNDDAPQRPALALGAPQGPMVTGGLRDGDLPVGGTLTGAPASGLARIGDTVYASGVEWVAPLRGSAVALNPQTGAFAKALGTNGRIADAVADGRGGVYLAGDFDRAGSRRRRGLVHLFGTGEVDRRFRPRFDGFVSSLVLDGGLLYAGGSPDGLRGLGVRGVVALNAGTGADLPGFTTDVAPGVTELALRGKTLYVGGSTPGLRGRFETPEPGEERTDAPLVALDARSGERVPGFAPAPLESKRSSISALRVVDGKLWVGRKALRQPELALSLLDPDTGATVEDTAVRGWVRELIRDGNRVLAIGNLRGRGGRDLVHALDPATGARRSGFRVRGGGSRLAPVAHDGVVRGTELWLGGQRRSMSSGAPTGFVGAYDLKTGAASRQVTAPTPDGPVDALVSAGGRVVAGGDFAAADVRRQDIAAFSATTGRYAAGVRLPVTRDASALAVAGGRLWVVDGARLLGVDPESGGVAARIALPAGATDVRLAGAGGRVFVSSSKFPGGVRAFEAATGRRALFALPQDSAEPRAPALLGDGNVLWVGGSFNRERPGRQPDTVSVLKLDARTGKLDAGFAPRLDGPVRGFALVDNRLYVGGRFARVGDLRRRNLAAVEPETGAAVAAFEPGFAPAADDVRLVPLGDGLLVARGDKRRAYAPDGGPTSATVNGARSVSATAPGAGDSQLVAGNLRSYSTLGAGASRGVVLPPRG